MVSLSDFNLPEILMPLSNQLNFILRKIQLLVGGIFGLYFIAFIIRLIHDRKNARRLEYIQHQLDDIKKQLSRLSPKRK